MKRAVAVFLTLVLLAGFAACGKEAAAPADDPEEWTDSVPVVEEEPQTAAVQEGSTTVKDGENEESATEPDPLSFAKYDAKTGTLTISGTEEFQLPWDYDVSSIKHIVISDDVLSADLDPSQNAYTRLETVRCSPDCDVTVSTSNITATPFYQNSANWTDGVLYIGSRLAAINKNAPAVCKFGRDFSSIDWDLAKDIAKTAPQIKRFEAAEGSKTFQTDDNGILYQNNYTQIALFPPASPLVTYDVPDSLEGIQIMAGKNLKTIHISAKSSLNESIVDVVPTISEYIVDPGHPYLFAKDGVLFRKSTEEDSTEWYLVDYPGSKQASEYRIPDHTCRCYDGAFHGCANLTTLYIPASVTYFGEIEGFWSAFFYSKKLEHVYVDKGNKNYGSTKDGLFLILGEDQSEDGKTTARTTMVYLPGRKDKRFAIPSGIQGFEAYGNAYLETIELGKDVDLISVDECPALRVFRAEDNQNGYSAKNGVLYKKWQDWKDPTKEVTALMYYPAGKQDKRFTVPDGIAELLGAGEWSSDSAFHNNPYIEEITLPDSVTFIGMGAFAGCTSLKKVRLPDSLEHLGNGAFHGCTALHELTIPVSLEALGYYDGNSEYALGGSSITDIHFKGTQAQWNTLVTATGVPAALPSGVRVHCTDGENA